MQFVRITLSFLFLSSIFITQTNLASYAFGTDPYASTSSRPVNAFHCGDGCLDSGEQCDDGNTMDGDGCSSTCEYEWDTSSAQAPMTP